MEQIRLEGLSYTYPDGVHALRGVDLGVFSGERLALLGPNGAGKSTLFLCLNGVLRAQSGAMQYAGEKIGRDKKGQNFLRRKIGVIFQDPDAQLFCPDVWQEVAFGPRNLGCSEAEVTEQVRKSLRLFGLEELAGRPPHLLSGGQKKLVSIAAVLVMRPEVLLFDEPFASLDPTHAQILRELLEALNDAGTTILLSTHDADFAYEWADRIAVMREGQIVAAGEPENIFADPLLLLQNGLREPAVRTFYQALVAWGIVLTHPPRSFAELQEQRFPVTMPEVQAPEEAPDYTFATALEGAIQEYDNV